MNYSSEFVVLPHHLKSPSGCNYYQCVGIFVQFILAVVGTGSLTTINGRLLLKVLCNTVLLISHVN